MKCRDGDAQLVNDLRLISPWLKPGALRRTSVKVATQRPPNESWKDKLHDYASPVSFFRAVHVMKAQIEEPVTEATEFVREPASRFLRGYTDIIGALAAIDSPAMRRQLKGHTVEDICKAIIVQAAQTSG